MMGKMARKIFAPLAPSAVALATASSSVMPVSPTALSTMTIQMESFYASAVDADIMIYNSTIDGEIRTIDELLTKSPLLADCKAVQAGTVWCITKNFYQESLALGDLILDVHAILQDKAAENLHFLRKLS